MFKIKLNKRKFGRYAVYDIIVSRVVNRNSVDAVENLGTYSPHYPQKYAFINMERLAYWVYSGANVSHSVLKIISFL